MRNVSEFKFCHKMCSAVVRMIRQHHVILILLLFKWCQLWFKAPQNNCLVVLHNFFWVGAGGWIFLFIYFFKSKSKLHWIIASSPPNENSNRSILPIYFFIQVKAIFRCKQIDNKTFKTVLKPENSTKKKKNFLGILKIRRSTLCTVKTFFQFFKIRGGWWRTTKQLFLGLIKWLMSDFLVRKRCTRNALHFQTSSFLELTITLWSNERKIQDPLAHS